MSHHANSVFRELTVPFVSEEIKNRIPTTINWLYGHNIQDTHIGEWDEYVYLDADMYPHVITGKKLLCMHIDSVVCFIKLDRNLNAASPL
jgi:hypothetical protein